MNCEVKVILATLWPLLFRPSQEAYFYGGTVLKVIHFLPGRVRVELQGLNNNPVLASFLEGCLGQMRGIVHSQASFVSGRLLVVYAPDILSWVQVKEQIKKIMAIKKLQPVPAKKKEKGNKKDDGEMHLYELERLPLARQFFMTVVSGLFLVYVLFKPGMNFPRKGAGANRLLGFENVLTIMSGYPIFRTAFDHLWKKGRLTSEFLAGIASVAALTIQESRLGLFILWLTYLSTLLRTLAQEHARDRVRVMLQGKQPIARIKTSTGEIIIPGTQISPGSQIIVKRGERIPVDGSVVQGTALVSMCPVMGPSPIVAGEGHTVYAGCLLMQGELHIRAEKVGRDTHISRKIQLLEGKDRSYSSHSIQTVRLMNRLSYLSLIVSSCVFLVTRDVKLAVATLVVGTPGAAGLASSMAFGTGAGAAAGRGILVKAGRHMDHMARVNTVLFGQSTLLEKTNNTDLKTVSMIHRAGVPYIGLLTEEPRDETHAMKSRLQLEETWPECKPQEKAAIIGKLRKQGRVLALIVEKDSDALALSAADVGITLARAHDLDLKSADIIITGGDSRQVALLLFLARQSLSTARQNIIVSVGANLIGLSFGVLGLLSPFTMALLQNISTLAILLNSGRLLLSVGQEEKQPVVCEEAAATLDPSSYQVTVRAKTVPARLIKPNQRQVRENYGRIPLGVQRAISKTTLIQTSVSPNVTYRKSSPIPGLSSHEAAARIVACGYNTLPECPRASLTELFRQQLQNVMSKVLLGLAGVSLILGKHGNAAVSAGVLLANTLLAALQEQRTENSLRMLKSMIAPRALAIRDGKEKDIPARSLVPGDVIIVKAGDQVPADACIIGDSRLVVEEASLTGESVPVNKKGTINGRNGTIYMGTGILSGRAKALVVATGPHTEMGHIAKIVGIKGSGTIPLYRHLDEVGITFVFGGLAVSSLSILAGIWHGDSTNKIILNATSLAISLIPDSLAPIITLAMACGALRMIKRRVIVRHFPTVDTLGCTSVICCDKTGTLTKNRMAAAEILCPGQHWVFNGNEYMLANTSMELENKPDKKSIERLFQIACLCNNAVLQGKGPDGWLAVGDSTECALLIGALKAGMPPGDLTAGFTRLEEIPFDPETLRMIVVCRCRNGFRWSFVKGAPDILLERCSRLSCHGILMPLTEDAKNEILLKVNDMSLRAMRVLALAYKPLIGSENPDEGLVFAGLVGLVDPPRSEVKAALQKCRRAGVDVVLITGDHRNTALALARATNIVQEGAKALTGMEIEQMNEKELARLVGDVKVYARITPQNKQRLVKALKAQGRVVAMIGDGVNDIPAIKEAHLGIAMGGSSVAVTKEAAGVTLMNDNMAMIPEAIKEGRAVYDNIRKCVRYLTTTNIGDGVVILIASLLGRPVPLNALQLIWVNLASDPLISWLLANEQPVQGVLNRMPRRNNESIFSKGLGRKIINRGLTMGLGAFAVYHGSQAAGENLELARTKTMAALGLGRLFHLSDCCRGNYGHSNRLGANRGVTLGSGVILASLAGAMYVPFIRSILRTAPLSLQQLLPVLVWSGLGVIADRGLGFLTKKANKSSGISQKQGA